MQPVLLLDCSECVHRDKFMCMCICWWLLFPLGLLVLRFQLVSAPCMFEGLKPVLTASLVNLITIFTYVLFKGLLDYLDNLTVTQIRKLFSMLSTLAFANQQDGGLIQVLTTHYLYLKKKVI